MFGSFLHDIQAILNKVIIESGAVKLDEIQ